MSIKEKARKIMTENDYIAEYVKERHPGILGFDYAMWRAVRMAIKNWPRLRRSPSFNRLERDRSTRR